VAKYNAMGIPLSRMNKIFLTHVHGDHMSDLTHIYCFGPAYDRKTPLYVWGPGRSGVPDPVHPAIIYEDGTAAFCGRLREAVRWHTESFSFQTTAFADDDWALVRPTWTCPHASPSAPPDLKDAYDLVPFELNWATEGSDNVAYQNPDTGVTITHFPVVHTRQGAIGYRLEWNSPNGVLSMIFTGDTKPTNYVVRQALGGVDVLIHEVTTSAADWVEKFVGIHPGDDGYEEAVREAQAVQDSSHTEQLAFGYLLKKIATCGKAPRLAVGTHFPASDDTVRAALADIGLQYAGDVALATDFFVINVSKARIRQRRAVASEYNGLPIDPAATSGKRFDPPKYNTTDENGRVVGDPYAQLDPDADVITQQEWRNGVVPACPAAAK
jgi:ribonuclease Z